MFPLGGAGHFQQQKVTAMKHENSNVANEIDDTRDVDSDRRRVMLDIPDPQAPPPNEDWAARREAADALRRLIGLMATTTSDAAVMRALARNLHAQAGLLAEAPQMHGRAAFAEFEQGRMGSWGDIARETNPLSGHGNPLAPPLMLWLEGDTAHGRATLGWQYEGPPSSVHGGFVCALFDHFLGMTQRLTGQPGVTGTLTTRFHRPTPLNTELELVGRVVEVSGRKNLLRGEIRANGMLTASCEGTFIFISKQRFRAMVAGCDGDAEAAD